MLQPAGPRLQAGSRSTNHIPLFHMIHIWKSIRHWISERQWQCRLLPWTSWKRKRAWEGTTVINQLVMYQSHNHLNITVHLCSTNLALSYHIIVRSTNLALISPCIHICVKAKTSLFNLMYIWCTNETTEITAFTSSKVSWFSQEYKYHRSQSRSTGYKA